jgi:RimJ/RimL family protein N-acetyltransferase
VASNVDLQATLEGARVTVRPIAATDWQALFAAASDPKIWELHPAKDRYTEPVFKSYFDAAIESHSAFVFIDKETGDVIGSSRYYGHDLESREIEIGWTFLTRPNWGGSYNAEIKQLMVDHAFTFVDTVVFWVGDDNFRSRRAVEKIGGVLREGTYKRDASDAARHVIYELKK